MHAGDLVEVDEVTPDGPLKDLYGKAKMGAAGTSPKRKSIRGLEKIRIWPWVILSVEG